MSRFFDALRRPTEIAWLAAFRCLYGLSMCVSMLRLIGYGWLEELFVRPTFHFKYWGFAWVEPLPQSGLLVLAWALSALALAVALGFCFRVSALLLVAGFSYLQLIDVTTYLNHYYLASLLGFLLAWSPAQRTWSLDVWLWPRLRRVTIPAAWLYLFRYQVGIVYSFAGIAKMHADWLLGGEPLTIWLASRTDLPWLGHWFALPGVPLLMSWAGCLFDTTIVWWLLWRKTRTFAYALVIVFHLLTKLLFPIGMFPTIMVLSALVFFPADWPRVAARRCATLFVCLRRGATPFALAGRVTALFPPAPEVAKSESASLRACPVPSVVFRFNSFAWALGALYCLLQLTVPLRFLIYGGNVRWHEQGMRFSWRVMVREKNGSVTYVVRQKITGRVWHVSPHRYLTGLQEREISAQPDLILQLAHHIAHDFSERQLGPVEVRVDALVSLNGRAAIRLIDSTVDLASIQDGFAKFDWVLPSPRSELPRVRTLSHSDAVTL